MKTKIVILALGMLIGSMSVIAQSETNSLSSVAVKALGLQGVPFDIANRHIQISQQVAASQVRQDDVPVHIVYRRDQSDEWHLVGTGTIFSSWSNSVVTAYHVLAGAPGQYGCRRIGAAELAGCEPVMPIVGFKNPTKDVDDVIVLDLGVKGSSFPEINVPESDKIFKGFGNKDFTLTRQEALIHPLTYPGQTQQSAFSVEVRPGVTYVFSFGEVQPGESGTSACVDGMPSDCRLITVRPDHINNQDLATWLGTTNNAPYSVGYLIKVK